MNMNDSRDWQNKLTQVREGMDVYDINEQRVGTVESVAFGSMGAASPGNTIAEATGPATGDNWEAPGEDTFFEDIAEALYGEEELSETVRSRLLREGYIKIDSSGLFASDRFVLPEQIASISGDRIQLSVPEDDLIHR